MPPSASWPPFLQPQADGILLHVKVQPRSSRNEVAGVLGGELKLKVTAPPVDDAANEAVVALLAGVLGCPRGAVALVRGNTARHKVVRVHGMTAPHAAARLQSFL